MNLLVGTGKMKRACNPCCEFAAQLFLYFVLKYIHVRHDVPCTHPLSFCYSYNHAVLEAQDHLTRGPPLSFSGQHMDAW